MNEDFVEIKDYFEVGCLCILIGELIPPEGLTTEEVVSFYEQNCKCSRNYKHLEEKQNAIQS